MNLGHPPEDGHGGFGRCEVALDLEGVARALIGFPIGATIALSAGMIMLFVFAAMDAALVLWSGERSDFLSGPRGGLGYLPIEVLMLECLWRQTNCRAEQPY